MTGRTFQRELAAGRRTALRWGIRAGRNLTERSRNFVRALNRRMETIILVWLGLFCTAAAVRIAFGVSPIRDPLDFIELFLPYALAALAPVAGYRIAVAAFPGGLMLAQPSFRLARYGRWRRLGLLKARAHRAFGPFGFLASLLLGMLINVPVRSFEFLLAVPAMNHHAPGWGTAIFHLMAADLIVMNFLYAVCFVMALRIVPLFPRMLLFVWLMDVMLQLAIARSIGTDPELPANVAMALQELLTGNVKKVAISAAIWLPYLLLSERVNVTYRSRTGA